MRAKGRGDTGARWLVGLVASVVALLEGAEAPARSRMRGEALKVKGFRPAIVVAPRAVKGTRPLIVALHGNFDRPTWQCDAWRGEVAGRAWLLCTRGRPRRDAPGLRRYTYRSPKQVDKEIAAAHAALVAQQGQRVAKLPPVLVIGFSLGATYASRLAVRQPARYPRVLLVEGGHTIWTVKRARAFRRRGGRSVAFACGSGWCIRRSKKTCPRLRRAKVSCHVTSVRGLGHSYGPRLAKRARPLIDAALAGWSGAVTP